MDGGSNGTDSAPRAARPTTGETGHLRREEAPKPGACMIEQHSSKKNSRRRMMRTGYYGLQINWDEKTIEGDLFKAFIAAGAISKANADDPKKSSLSRCARTDKGVHAAGNLISLKLIIEDDDIVDKINAHLPDQIRVWGLQRTSNSFSAYQACDSRWYEYLLPTYCLLPSHPDSFLWKKLVESAQEKGYYNDFQSQLADVDGFWAEVEEQAIKPILERLDPQVRAEVLERIHASDDHPESALKKSAPNDAMQVDPPATAVAGEATSGEDTSTTATTGKTKNLGPVDFALRDMKNAYVKAKRAYQVTNERLDQLQAALDQYVGTYNFHNYTIQKSFKDPSAKRHIKSFQVNKTPIQIRDTQWVSIKVHGQSFMMHQIRKMISMATLVQVDNFKSDYFLWLTAGGIQAGAIRASKPFSKDDKASNVALVDDEDEDPEGGEG
ncbi:tRNA pseudouridine synthase [Verticillium alfalfae VaMs.102]|uniref:tRNA pseudouridine synthase n=1 Tax=Verticillium alfalfae (strain VaMs.102 / ATCC MYA-4576 / FGSC 10136) TaxID=526221 RepID=C9SDK5_VERA1|nr:tRNA pseudouridine synthase [Verticillium alfalfae VaMs.102]EEY16426.1 tRNA pseudouridine synthase [Verticillium alfalfae VaMs.102]